MSQACSIVEDLLPLYKNEALQANTVKFIEQHIACCEHCQQLAYSQPSPKPSIPFKQTLSFFHVIFIVLSFMFALNSSLLGIILALLCPMHFLVALLICSIKIAGLFLL